MTKVGCWGRKASENRCLVQVADAGGGHDADPDAVNKDEEFPPSTPLMAQPCKEAEPVKEEIRERSMRRSSTMQVVETKEYDKAQPDSLDEDAYGHGIASLIRDTERFVNGTEFPRVHAVRLAMSISMMLLVVGLQLFLLGSIQRFIVQPSVMRARDVYDRYERHMYGCDDGEDCAERTFLTRNGKHRGLPEFFDEDRFHTLDPSLKKIACSISLSQPCYFGTILLIWTLTCFSDMNKAWRSGLRLTWYTPTIETMRKALDTETEDRFYETDGTQLIVIGLTRPLKWFITLILVVRQATNARLMWLGCRWLAATEDFSDILLNAVALEFILLLRELIYNAMVPARSRRETANTLILPAERSAAPSLVVLGRQSLWGIAALAWVFIYIYWFQRVLPQYNWDVHKVCADWLSEELGETQHAGHKMRGSAQGTAHKGR